MTQKQCFYGFQIETQILDPQKTPKIGFFTFRKSSLPTRPLFEKMGFWAFWVFDHPRINPFFWVIFCHFFLFYTKIVQKTCFKWPKWSFLSVFGVLRHKIDLFSWFYRFFPQIKPGFEQLRSSKTLKNDLKTVFFDQKWPKMTLFWPSKRACQVFDPFSKEGGPSAETDKKALKNDSFLSNFDAKTPFYG